MKKILIIIPMLITLSSYSQDVIHFKNSDSLIAAQIIEVRKNEIKYKKYDHFNGPTYAFDINDINSIKYENGEEDVFLDHNEKDRKAFIWAPKKQKEPYPPLITKSNFSIIINDKRREYPSKSKIEFQSNELKNFLSNILREQDVNKKIVENSPIELRIIIEEYDATFYPGYWHTKTSYLVTIFNHNDSSTVEKRIEHKKGFYNVGGMATAKNRLSKSFFSANEELINFINDSI